MATNKRKRLSLAVLVLIGVALGLIFKNIKFGMIFGLIIGVLISSWAGKKN